LNKIRVPLHLFCLADMSAKSLETITQVLNDVDFEFVNGASCQWTPDSLKPLITQLESPVWTDVRQAVYKLVSEADENLDLLKKLHIPVVLLKIVVSADDMNPQVKALATKIINKDTTVHSRRTIQRYFTALRNTAFQVREGLDHDLQQALVIDLQRQLGDRLKFQRKVDKLREFFVSSTEEMAGLLGYTLKEYAAGEDSDDNNIQEEAAAEGETQLL
jgi:hypothetical protein